MMTTDMTHRSGRSPYEVELEDAILGLWDEDQIMVPEADRHFLLEHHVRPELPEFGGVDHETDFPVADEIEAYRVNTHSGRIVLWPPMSREPERTGPEQDTDHASDARTRLDRVNRHFRRKAGAVFNDVDALGLLTRMNSKIVVETSDFDFCNGGRSLAKLTAANFCDVGANGIYITDRGRRFIAKLNTV
jgi:hypothetical protein